MRKGCLQALPGLPLHTARGTGNKGVWLSYLVLNVQKTPSDPGKSAN